MNYSSAIHLLFRLERFGIKLGLERIKRLLKDLGEPERNLKIIHIAGTNGKGSVAAMIVSILQAAGFSSGLFTSPHLTDWRERLAVFPGGKMASGERGQCISKKEFSAGIEKLKPFIDRIKKEKNSPTIFECLTALALSYFADKKVDFAIMEAGLGGRLDATNVLSPLVSVITNVALEHTVYLGNTKAKIAREKAGIIKEKGIVVTAEADPDILKIIKEKCKEKAAKLIQVKKDVKILSYQLGISKRRIKSKFSVRGQKALYQNLELSLLGRHQAVNAATAIGAIEGLAFSGIEICPQAVKRGLKAVYPGSKNSGPGVNWPARLEIISNKPAVLLDGAHNPAAAAAIANSLKALKKADFYQELFLIVGCLKDKDVNGILSAFLPLTSHIVVTRSQNSRFLEPIILSRQAAKYGRKCVLKSRVKDALDYALTKARRNDLILVTGSFYLMGEIKEFDIQ